MSDMKDETAASLAAHRRKQTKQAAQHSINSDRHITRRRSVKA